VGFIPSLKELARDGGAEHPSLGAGWYSEAVRARAGAWAMNRHHSIERDGKRDLEVSTEPVIVPLRRLHELCCGANRRPYKGS
jgi:hypothetical protein